MFTSLMAAYLSLLSAQNPPSTDLPRKHMAPAEVIAVAPTAKNMSWTIGGVKRQAIVYIPATATKSDTPVVFAFHGHGGTAKHAAAMFEIHQHWPEAISVYMQGLPSPGMTDPKGVRNGWQKSVGDLGDRDLKFFDSVLTTLKEDYKVDERRIYATGHSNGGGFTYLLWAARGDVFAAVAPSAGGLRDLGSLKPKPAMHIAGEKDTTVPYRLQQRTMARVRELNGCEPDGKEWARAGDLVATRYASKTGTPFVSVIYPGTHKYPHEAPQLIVKFFRSESKPNRAGPGHAEGKANTDEGSTPN